MAAKRKTSGAAQRDDRTRPGADPVNLPDPPAKSRPRLALAAVLLVAWIVFLMVLAAPRWRRNEGASVPAPPAQDAGRGVE